MARARNLTLVTVGDEASKKTDLLLKYTTDKKLGSRFEPSVFINNVQYIVVDHVPYSVYFVDTDSDDDYKNLRLNSYKKADCFLLCYSIANRKSFENIAKKWCIEVRKCCPNVPITLVGTEAELRRSSEPSSNFVSIKEGENLRYLIGATSFVECSIQEESIGVDEVFIQAIRSLYRK